MTTGTPASGRGGSPERRRAAAFWRGVCGALTLVIGLWPVGLPAETLTLADCLRETAIANPAIVQQQFAIQSAYGERLRLRATALPTLTGTGILGYQGAQTAEVLRSAGVDANGRPLPQTTGARNSTAILLGSAQLTQPLFDTSIPAYWRLGTLGVTAAQETFYVVATAALAQTRSLFIRAIYYQQREELLRQTDRILQSNLQAQNALLNAGLGGRQGVLTSQVQRANFDPVITANQGSYHSILALLLQGMGRNLPPAVGKADPLDGITLAGDLEAAPLEFDPAVAARAALATRPDLQSLRLAMRTYVENAQVARSGYFPKVQLYLAGQYLPQTYISSQSASTRASDRIQTTELRPGVQGSWTVIDTGVIRGQTRQYEAIRATLADGLRKLELAIPADLATVRGQADASYQAMMGLQGNVATAQDTLNIIQAGIAQGVNSQLEFLDAQSGVYQTRLGLLEARRTLGEAHAELDRITGRYVRFILDPPAARRAGAAQK